ncbi:MAG: ABC transporter substrate-binding protein [Methanobacteriaceae archaeon]
MKHLVKIVWINLVISALVVGVISPVWAQKAPYKIGCNFEFSGIYAGAMSYVKKGLILEQERVNVQGGIDGHPLELIFEDNGFDIPKAANIQQKLARNKEIKAIIGPMSSLFSPTIYPITEREQIPQLFMCAPSGFERKMKRHWIFHTPQGDIPLSGRLMDLIMGRGYKKVFAFIGRGQIFIEAGKLMKEIGQKNGVEVFITNETYQPGDTDMTAQIVKVKDQLKSYDAIWLGCSGVQGVSILRNLKEQGIRMPVLGNHMWGFQATLTTGKELLEGAEIVSGKVSVAEQLDDSDPQKPILLAFDKRMKARWDGLPADQISSHAHDSILILYHAFKKAGENPTRAQLRDAIEMTKNLVACGGIFNYSATDHDGLDRKSLALVRIENNKFVRIKFPQYE